MSSSDTERTEAAAGVEEERIPRTKTTTPGDRRPSAFTAKDVLEAEELKRTVMSVLEAGGFEGTLSGLDRAWPEVVGGHRPSLAEQLDAERRRDIERQIVQLRRELGVALPAPAATADRTTRSMVVAELQERAATVAARIPELPLPRVDRVPESIVSQTYTKQEGAKKNREACGMCVNCARNEAPGRARRANGDGHGKRRKTSRRPCLTIAAVEMYENNMGYLNGDDMLRIVETMQGGGAGATGRGVRCGKCRQCLGFQNQGKRRAKCFAVAAVSNGTVPPRLLPVVKLAAAEAEDRMLLSYPYIKQVDELRMTGVEWLLKNKDEERDRRRIRGATVEDGIIEADEAARWGAANAPSASRTGRPRREREDSQGYDELSAVDIGRVLQSSVFGESVAAFDEALLAAIRERHALTLGRDVLADRDGDRHGEVGGGTGQTSGDDGCEQHGEEREELYVARSAQTVRDPLYRLIEATLNEAAVKLARKAVPTQFRNKNAGDKRIFRERTDIASFPSLPDGALDWYRRLDQGTEAAAPDPAAPDPAPHVPPEHQHKEPDIEDACGPSIDELIEDLPSDVRLPFLASVGLVGGTVARRAIERFRIRSGR